MKNSPVGSRTLTCLSFSRRNTATRDNHSETPSDSDALQLFVMSSGSENQRYYEALFEVYRRWLSFILVSERDQAILAQAAFSQLRTCSAGSYIWNLSSVGSSCSKFVSVEGMPKETWREQLQGHVQEKWKFDLGSLFSFQLFEVDLLASMIGHAVFWYMKIICFQLAGMLHGYAAEEVSVQTLVRNQPPASSM